MVHGSRLTITVHGHPYGSRSNANVIGQGQKSRSSLGPTRPILLTPNTLSFQKGYGERIFQPRKQIKLLLFRFSSCT